MLLVWLTAHCAPALQRLPGSGGQVRGCPGAMALGQGVRLELILPHPALVGLAVRGARLRGLYQCVLASRCPPPARVGAGQHVQPVLGLPLALHPAAPPAPLPQLWEGRTGLGWSVWGSPGNPALLSPSLVSRQIFCARCSPNTAVLPHYGQAKPVRVCTHCYTTHLPPTSRCARSQ